MYSFDGISALYNNSQSNGVFGEVNSVTYYAGVSGGTWVIVGRGYFNYAKSFYSTDGITWFPSPNFNGLFQNGSWSVGSVSGI